MSPPWPPFACRWPAEVSIRAPDETPSPMRPTRPPTARTRPGRTPLSVERAVTRLAEWAVDQSAERAAAAARPVQSQGLPAAAAPPVRPERAVQRAMPPRAPPARARATLVAGEPAAATPQPAAARISTAPIRVSGARPATPASPSSPPTIPRRGARAPVTPRESAGASAGSPARQRPRAAWPIHRAVRTASAATRPARAPASLAMSRGRWGPVCRSQGPRAARARRARAAAPSAECATTARTGPASTRPSRAAPDRPAPREH